MHGKKGFTVVEILLVLAILLLIATFTTPLAFKKINDAKDAAAAATLSNIVSIYNMANEFAALKGITPSDNHVYLIKIPADDKVMETEYSQFIYEQINLSFENKIKGQYKIVVFKTEFANGIRAYYTPPDAKNKHYKWENGKITKIKGKLTE
ncbi:MAG: prepilin-type N-terminal cleavage/methylation domain-containing protein [Oscillospiraceae bacterium]